MQPVRVRVTKLTIVGLDAIGPRNGHSATRIGSSIYVYGGFHSTTGKVFSDMWEIDTAKKECRQVHYLSACTAGERAFHTATYIGDGRIMILGGRRDSKPLHNSIHIFDIESRSWIKQSRSGQSPSSRHFHTVVVDESASRIILFGGWDFERWLSDVFVMNTENFAWECHRMSSFHIAPQPRCCHASIMIPVSAHDLKKNSSEANTTASNTQSQSRFIDKKQMLMFGGDTQTGYSADAYVFSPDKLCWAVAQPRFGSVPPARAGHTMVVLGGHILIFGGHGLVSRLLFRRDVYFNDAYIAGIVPDSDDTISINWQKVELIGTLPEPRASHTMTSFGDTAYLFGGWDGEKVFCDLYSFELESNATKTPKPATRDSVELKDFELISFKSRDSKKPGKEPTIQEPSTPARLPASETEEGQPSTGDQKDCKKEAEETKKPIMMNQERASPNPIQIHKQVEGLQSLSSDRTHESSELLFLRNEVLRLRSALLFLSEKQESPRTPPSTQPLTLSPIAESAEGNNRDGEEKFDVCNRISSEGKPGYNDCVSNNSEETPMDWKCANYAQAFRAYQRVMHHQRKVNAPSDSQTEFERMNFIDLPFLFAANLDITNS